MTFIPANSNRDFWAVVGALFATLLALFGGTAWARRRAERRAAAQAAAVAEAGAPGPAPTGLSDSPPEP